MPDIVATIVSDEEVIMMGDSDKVTFGRDASSTLRIGHAPVYDDVVPRRAGLLTAFQKRVMVANLSMTLAFDVCSDDRPPMIVRPGDLFSPPHHRFDICVTGGSFTYVLTVTINTAGVDTSLARDDVTIIDAPPTGGRPALTDRQLSVIDVYTQPVRDGLQPASHQEVADSLGISRSLVRLECNRIWSELLLAGVPMRDLSDKRDAVVDAWTRHRF